MPADAPASLPPDPAAWWVATVALALLVGAGVGAAWLASRRRIPGVDAPGDVAEDVAGRVADLLREERHAEIVASTRLDARLEALGSDLGRLAGLVRAVETDRAEQLGSLGRHLEETLRTTSRLDATARDLHRVLSSDRARGQWGERMAEDVLRAAGLVEGVNYVLRRRLPSGGVPDVTLLLPEGRRMHLDVKFPLANYLRLLESADEVTGQRHRAAFLRDARQRILEISDRDYLRDDASVGVILLLVPNEAVFAYLQEHAPQIFDDAMAAGITVCSPLTLFAVLAVVRQAVDAVHLAESSQEIRRCLDDVERQWQRHVADLDKLGTHLRHAQRVHDEITGPGRRRVEGSLEAVTRLGRGRSSGSRSDETTAEDPDGSLERSFGA